MSVQRIEAQRGVAFALDAGEVLEVIDLEGEQVADLYCFDRADLHDGLSSGRSIDYSERIAFTTGDSLYSQRGHVMLTIEADSCGTHDFLVTPCSLQMFQMMQKNDAYHPSCLENLTTAFEPFGIAAHQVGTTFNVFMNVPVSPEGRIRVLPPRSKPGASLRLRAERDLIVGLTACSDEGSNGGRCKPIGYQVHRSAQ